MTAKWKCHSILRWQNVSRKSAHIPRQQQKGDPLYSGETTPSVRSLMQLLRGWTVGESVSSQSTSSDGWMCQAMEEQGRKWWETRQWVMQPLRGRNLRKQFKILIKLTRAKNHWKAKVSDGRRQTQVIKKGPGKCCQEALHLKWHVSPGFIESTNFFDKDMAHRIIQCNQSTNARIEC